MWIALYCICAFVQAILCARYINKGSPVFNVVIFSLIAPVITLAIIWDLIHGFITWLVMVKVK